MTSSADHEHNRKSGSHCGRDCVQVDPQQTSALSLASGAVPSAPNGDSLGSCGNRVNERAYPPPLHQSVAIRTRCTLVSKYGCFLEASKRAPQAQTAVPALHVTTPSRGFMDVQCCPRIQDAALLLRRTRRRVRPGSSRISTGSSASTLSRRGDEAVKSAGLGAGSATCSDEEPAPVRRPCRWRFEAVSGEDSSTVRDVDALVVVLLSGNTRSLQTKKPSMLCTCG